jgi:hypothetical protein
MALNYERLIGALKCLMVLWNEGSIQKNSHEHFTINTLDGMAY